MVVLRMSRGFRYLSRLGLAYYGGIKGSFFALVFPTFNHLQRHSQRPLLSSSSINRYVGSFINHGTFILCFMMIKKENSAMLTISLFTRRSWLLTNSTLDLTQTNNTCSFIDSLYYVLS